MTEEPLVLPFRADHQQLVEGLQAIVRAIEALKASEERTRQETERTATSLDQLRSGLSNVRGGFRDTYDVIDAWVGRVNSAVDRVTALASEQERLNFVSARTGLDLDRAAEAAGRFADETEAAQAATTLLQAGVRVSQQELDALMRVAGATSQTLGITTAQAVQRLTDTLVSGSVEGLRRFTPDLVDLGGEAHSASERVRALVGVAEQTPQAMDNASDSVARFRDRIDDASRTIATSFVQEWQRLSDLGKPFRDASSDAEELNRDLQAMGQTAARVLGLVGNTLGVVGGFVATGGAAALRLAQRGINAVQLQDDDGRMETTDELADFTRRRWRALMGMLDDGDQRTTADTTEDDRRARAARADNAARLAQAAQDLQRRREAERLARRRRLGLDDDDDEMSGANTRADLESAPTIEVRGRAPGRGGGRGGGRDAAFERRLREENARVEALREIRAERERVENLLRDAAQERRGEEREAQRARDQTMRGRDADAQRRDWSRTDAGLRAANEDARGRRQEESSLRRRQQSLRTDDDLRSENTDARLERQEARALDHRRQNLRSFTDFYEEQQQRQVVAAQEAANGVSFAFDSMGKAYAKHLMAVVQGREELGAALQGMLADTLTAIAEESAKQAGVNLAGGFAALATYRYDAAANHFAAAGIYTGLAVGTGLAGAALQPETARQGGASRAEGERSRALDTGRNKASNDNAKGTTIIEMHYYSPVIGGRESTESEVGRHMQRYTSASDRRRLGRAGSGG